MEEGADRWGQSVSEREQEGRWVGLEWAGERSWAKRAEQRRKERRRKFFSFFLT